jgi:PAS domain-containing protein
MPMPTIWRPRSRACGSADAAFETSLTARDGRQVRAVGSVLGNGASLRLRPARVQADASVATDDPATARTLLARLGEPAFLRDAAGRISYANAPYHDLARTLGRRGSEAQPAELAEPRRGADGGAHELVLGEAGSFEMVEFPLAGGSAGYLHARQSEPKKDASLAHLSAIIDALATPIAIFNARANWCSSTAPTAQLWGLDPNWLKPGMDERVILDRLRTDGMLPNEPDYQGWRARHLQTYQLKGPKELDPWHLPDGRTVQVIAAPAGPKGGVIYVFEDITDQLKLKSQHRAVLDVQRSTLNALTEAVAVFGTNGRLTLSNPRCRACGSCPPTCSPTTRISTRSPNGGRALPEDGAADLARPQALDHRPQPDAARQAGPHRPRRRQAHRLCHHAPARRADDDDLPRRHRECQLPARAQGKERGPAHRRPAEGRVRAERQLRAALATHQHHRLCRPARLGHGGRAQRQAASYTDYIRASSVTLGVLIDNILDLATVDAGIAELRPEQRRTSPRWSRRPAPAWPRRDLPRRQWRRRRSTSRW